MLPLMVVKSPRCDERVTLPAGLTPDTKVRCPFTKEEFLIQEILDDLPPMLEVIEIPPGAAAIPTAGLAAAAAGSSVADGESDVVAATAAEPGSEVASDGDAAGYPAFDFLHGPGKTESDADTASADTGTALFEPEGDGAQATAGSFDFAAADAAESQGVAAADGSTAAAPAKRKARPRPKKKQKNAVAEIVKIVLGGVAGLIIAQMILWWLPGKWRRDPIDLAPKLPSFLSWAAPAVLRNPEGDPGGSGQPASDDQSASQDDQPVAKFDPNVLNQPLPLPGSGNPDTTGLGGNPAMVEAGGGGDDDQDHGAVGEFDPIDDVKIDDVKIDDLVDKPPVEVALGVRSAPVFSGQDLGEALKEANDAKEIVDGAGGLDLSTKEGRGQAAKFYKGFCRLAERATFVDSTGQQVDSRKEAIKGILLDVGRTKKNLDAVGRLAETWLRLEKSERPGNGIMVAGTVTRLSSLGQLYDTQVRLSGSDQEVVTVMSKLDPGSELSEGDQVIILGTIVDEPSLQLGGYEGNLPVVVWGGYPVALPKANRRRRQIAGRRPRDSTRQQETKLIEIGFPRRWHRKARRKS